MNLKIFEFFHKSSLKKIVNDMSGFRLYSTTNYRPMEFGVITVGSTSDQSGILIPPYTSNYSLEFDCQTNCSNVI